MNSATAIQHSTAELRFFSSHSSQWLLFSGAIAALWFVDSTFYMEPLWTNQNPTANQLWTARRLFWKRAPALEASGVGTSVPPSVTCGGRRTAAVAVEMSRPPRSSAMPPPCCGACCFTSAVVCPTRRALSCVQNGWMVSVKHREEEEEGVRKKVRVKDSLSPSQCFCFSRQTGSGSKLTALVLVFEALFHICWLILFCVVHFSEI